MAERTPPSFAPFADDAAVCQFGSFSIENGTQAVSLHGNVSITRDRRGLDRARALKDVLDRIVACLEAGELPDVATDEPPATRTIRNPFA